MAKKYLTGIQWLLIFDKVLWVIQFILSSIHIYAYYNPGIHTHWSTQVILILEISNMKLNDLSVVSLRCEIFIELFIRPYRNFRIKFRTLQAAFLETSSIVYLSHALSQYLSFLTWGWSTKVQLTSLAVDHLQLHSFAPVLLFAHQNPAWYIYLNYEDGWIDINTQLFRRRHDNWYHSAYVYIKQKKNIYRKVDNPSR